MLKTWRNPLFLPVSPRIDTERPRSGHKQQETDTMPTKPRIEYKRSDYFNALAQEPLFGTGGKWLRCASFKDPMLWGSEEKRDNMLKLLRKEARK